MTQQDELMEDVMMKEYYNDVWDIVLKPERKNVVSSKWICKMLIEVRKDLWLEVSIRKRELILKR